MDLSKVLDLIKAFTYERFDTGKFIFKEGDPSNNKFYIILSGEVAVILKNKVGNFGKKQTIKRTRLTTQVIRALNATNIMKG